MDPSERFVRFAAECERMSKFSNTPENRTVWTRMAERWRRCAELYERQSSAAEHGTLTKRHRTRAHRWAQ